MASNGLVANPQKTSFILLNQKVRKDEIITITIGNEIDKQEKTVKLLGINEDCNQGWKTPIHGPGGIILSLNRRLFTLRRLRNHMSNEALLKLVDGLFMSKIRYGLQLLGKVRLIDSDPVNKDMECIQKVQNKLLRMLTKTSLMDMINTASLLKQANMMSVNQLNVQIKIQEIWKSLNIPDHPIQIARQTVNVDGPSTRASHDGRLIEKGFSCLAQKTCLNDAIRLWNKLPESVTKCDSFNQIKNKLNCLPNRCQFKMKKRNFVKWAG